MLRREAVLALGSIDRRRGCSVLLDLAVAPVEHDSVRIAALTALPSSHVEGLLERLADDPSPALAAYADKLRQGPTERRPVPGAVPLDRDAETRATSRCCEDCACCS